MVPLPLASSRLQSLTRARLAPHEDNWTDVLLLGHSMGGLLAADIALLFRHRIIGIVNFDVPFLGMHPGIIKAGLGSIFKSAPPPEDQLLADVASENKPSRMSTLFNPKPTDPNYNPSFHNDIHLPVRKGWENALHWFNKHSSGIREASKGLVKSHLEFGGAMADYRALKDRYARVRALEEDDENKRSSANPGIRSPPRIRFVNYYTASTGRPKKPKSPKSPSPSRSPSSLQHQDSDASQIATHTEESSGGDTALSTSNKSVEPKSFEPDVSPTLPEIPPIPQEPPFVDLMQYTDKTQRRAAEAEYDQALDAYRTAVKARNKIINDRQDIEEAWEQKKRQNIIDDRIKLEARWEEERRQLEANHSANEESTVDTPGVGQLEEDLGAMQLGHTSNQGGSQHRANYEFSTNTIMSQAPPDDRSSMHTTATNDTETTTPGSENDAASKKKKLGKFCMLPPNDAYGQKDPTWIRVFMVNMDEVAAHTGLFFVNETYERLVGDVGDRIEEWIREADSIRLVREMEGLN
jgi:hypothetical protein